MGLGNQSNSLGPRQGGSLPIGVEGCFTPCVEFVKSLLGFAQSTGVLRMHVDAIRTAVDLRGAHLQQVNEAEFKAASVKVLFQSIHRLLRFLGVLTGVNSGFHNKLLSYWRFRLRPCWPGRSARCLADLLHLNG